MLAAVSGEPRKPPRRYRAFFRIGAEVASGARPLALDPDPPPPRSRPTPAPKPPPKQPARPTLNWD